MTEITDAHDVKQLFTFAAFYLSVTLPEVLSPALAEFQAAALAMA